MIALWVFAILLGIPPGAKFGALAFDSRVGTASGGSPDVAILGTSGLADDVRPTRAPAGPSTEPVSDTIEVFAEGFPEAVAVLELSGEGSAPRIEWDPAELNFGVIAPGITAQRRVDVGNSGNRDLILSSAQLSHPDFSIFVADPLPTTLPPGASVGIMVRCAPGLSGVLNASLRLTSNDPSRPVATIPIRAEPRHSFELVVAARTGDPGPGGSRIESLGQGPSVNDAGLAAFVASLANGREVVLDSSARSLADRTAGIERFSPKPGLAMNGLSTNFRFDPFVQINNRGQVAWRASSRDGLFTFILLQGPEPSALQVVAKGRYVRIDLPNGNLNLYSPFAGELFAPSRAFYPWCSVNNGGQVVFSGHLADDETLTVLATPRFPGDPSTDRQEDFHLSPPLRNDPEFLPMIADNGSVVIRGGKQDTAPILLFPDPTLDVSRSAVLSDEFTSVGQAPGISDDGRVVAFVGLHRGLGAGIYVAYRTELPGEPPFGLVQVAGSADLAGFAQNSRVAVNRSVVDRPGYYAVLFKAQKRICTPPCPGLFLRDIDISQPATPRLGDLTVVAQAGETHADFTEPFTDFGVYDPLGNGLQVAFWASLANGGQAILQTRSVIIGFGNDLREYRRHGTPGVFRRGTDAVVTVTHPPGIPTTALRLLDLSDRRVIALGQPAAAVAPEIAAYTLSLPANLGIGRYIVEAETDLNGSLSKTDDQIHVIFEVPPLMDSLSTATYLYDEAGNRDSRSYELHTYSDPDHSTGSAPVIFKIWEESSAGRAFHLDPFHSDLFAKALGAVQGLDNPLEASRKLTRGVSRLIRYKKPNRERHVPRLLASVSEEQFQAAVQGIGPDPDPIEGQCLNYANCLTALLRGVGVPARVASGLYPGVVHNGGPWTLYAYHQWTEAVTGDRNDSADLWRALDATDDRSLDPLGLALPGDPIGDHPRATYPLAKLAYEVIVGGRTWTQDGGSYQLLNQPCSTPFYRVTRRAKAEDGAFEKCQWPDPPGGYAKDFCDCINAGSPTGLALASSDPSAGVELEIEVDAQAEFHRVGTVLPLGVRLINPLGIPQSVDVRLRQFELADGDDGGWEFGRPIEGGSTLPGPTLSETRSSQELGPGESATWTVPIALTDVDFPSLDHAVEIEATTARGKVRIVRRLGVLPAFDVQLVAAPGANRAGDPRPIQVRISSQVDFAVTGLRCDLDSVDSLAVLSATSFAVGELGPRETVTLPLELAALGDDPPDELLVQVRVTSANGGNVDQIMTQPGAGGVEVVSVTHPEFSGVGEVFHVEVGLRNSGTTVAPDVDLELTTGEGIDLRTLPIQRLHGLAPGGIRTVTWELVGGIAHTGAARLAVAPAGGPPGRIQWLPLRVVDLPPSATADIAVRLESAGAPTPTGEFGYRLVIQNLGPGSASGIVATNLPPFGSQVAEVLCASGFCRTTNGIVIWEIDSLGAGGTLSAEVKCVGSRSTDAVARATVGSEQPDPWRSNNAANLQFFPGAPPRLRARLDQGMVVLSWETADSDPAWRVETTTSLGPATRWENLGATPTVDAGAMEVRVQATAGPRFFRLIHGSTP